MDAIVTLLLTFITCIFIYVLTSPFTFRRFGNLPPGPYPFPVIGNILQLGINPHQSLAKLSKIYGPLMSLKLGTQTTIVVSSPTIAREILQKHDLVFSRRPVPHAAQVHGHDTSAMVWLPVSTQWKSLRKISREQLLSAQKLDSSQGLRQEKLKELFDYLRTCSFKGQVVNVGEAAFTTSLILMSNTLFNVSFATFGSESTGELKQLFRGLLEVVGTPNLADFFPFLRPFDPQGIRKRSSIIVGKILNSFDDIIKQRQVERDSSSPTNSRKQDLLDALLDEMDKTESELTMIDLKHLLLVFFVAGTDTTSVTIEWGITELLRNPEKLKKARAELKEIIGQKITIEESDIPKLPYLQSVIKETFRLHPSSPLLVPRKADANVQINGYIIPKDAHVLINVWAYGRDSNTWSNPDAFLPERFLESDINVRGTHFELIPFGGGRRICPGLPLGYRMVHLMIALLIHNFEWKLEDGIEPQDINMDEKFGLVASKGVPLKAIPVQI